MRTSDTTDGWTQDGTFQDADGTLVRCYDDIAVLEDVCSGPDGNGSTLPIPAGLIDTVLFYSIDNPCLLQVEYEVPGMIFGIVCAERTRLASRNEQEYPQRARSGLLRPDIGQPG